MKNKKTIFMIGLLLVGTLFFVVDNASAVSCTSWSSSYGGCTGTTLGYRYDYDATTTSCGNYCDNYPTATCCGWWEFDGYSECRATDGARISTGSFDSVSTCSASLAVNGDGCLSDAGCLSGNCDADLSGTLRCHATATSCVRDLTGTEITNGNYQCLTNKYQRKLCSSGTWSSALTGSNGQVCVGSVFQAPGPGGSCDNDWYQCDAVDDTTYDRYYVGYTTAGACTDTGKVLSANDIANPSGYLCSIGSTTAYAAYTSIMYTLACASNADCPDSTTFCHEFYWECRDLDICGNRQPGGGFFGQGTQSSSTDDMNNCGTTPECYFKDRIDTHNGLCSGIDYTLCQYTRSYVTTGDVCRNGVSINPNSGTDCGWGSQGCYCDNDWYQCDLNGDYTYDQYYVGYSSGVCTGTGAILKASNVANPTGYVCDARSSTTPVESYTDVMSKVSDGGACIYGLQCLSGLCVGAFCRASCDGYDEVYCSTNSVAYNVAGGVCTDGDNTCDYDEVAANGVTGGVLYSDCSDVGILNRCDSAAAPSSFSYEGACNSGNSCTTSGVLTNTGATSCAKLGNACDTDVGTQYTVDGICAGNTCDGTVVSKSSATVYESYCASLKQCDTNTANGVFLQDGTCSSNPGTSGCRTTGFVYPVSGYSDWSGNGVSVNYYDYDYDSNGMSCDNTLTNGDYYRTGMIALAPSGPSCLTGTVRIDDSNGNNFTSNCDSSQDLCDYQISLGTEGAPYASDGRCISNFCAVSPNPVCLSAGNYYSTMSSCGNGADCDISRSGTSPYAADAAEVCGASCVADNSVGLGGTCCSDTNCAGGNLCTAGTCQSACPILGADKFIVKNSVGTTCFEVDTTGNSLINGALTQSCTTAPPIDSFVVKFGTSTRGWIRDSDCAMCLYGTAADSQTVSYSGTDGLYVKNIGGTYVMKWDTAGVLSFAGSACYNNLGAWTAI